MLDSSANIYLIIYSTCWWAVMPTLRDVHDAQAALGTPGTGIAAVVVDPAADTGGPVHLERPESNFKFCECRHLKTLLLYNSIDFLLA